MYRILCRPLSRSFSTSGNFSAFLFGIGSAAPVHSEALQRLGERVFRAWPPHDQVGDRGTGRLVGGHHVEAHFCSCPVDLVEQLMAFDRDESRYGRAVLMASFLQWLAPRLGCGGNGVVGVGGVRVVPRHGAGRDVSMRSVPRWIPTFRRRPGLVAGVLGACVADRDGVCRRCADRCMPGLAVAGPAGVEACRGRWVRRREAVPGPKRGASNWGTCCPGPRR